MSRATGLRIWISMSLVSGLVCLASGLIILPSGLYAQEPTFEWVAAGGNPSVIDTRSSVAADEDGGYVMAGEFIDTAMFESHTLISAGGADLFLARYDGDGNLLWVIREGGTANDYARQVAIGPGGEIYLAGYFYDTLILSGQSFISVGSQDIFLASYTADGALLWVQTAGGLMADYCGGVAVAPDGSPILLGHFYADIFIAGDTLTSAGSSDVFVVKYDAAGNHLWTDQSGGPFRGRIKPASRDSEPRHERL